MLVRGVVTELETTQEDAQKRDKEVSNTDPKTKCKCGPSSLEVNSVPAHAVLLSIWEQDTKGRAAILIVHLVAVAMEQTLLIFLLSEFDIHPCIVNCIVSLSSAV